MFNPWLRKKIDNLRWLMQWQTRQMSCHREYVSPDLIHYFHYLQLQPGARVLVPLCGKSKDMSWLAEQGYPIIGVELSPIACEDFFSEMNVAPRITRQKHFIHYRHNHIELFCGDFFKLAPADLPPIDAIYDCRALVALPPIVRPQYVRHLLACSRKAVKILLMGFHSISNIKGPPFPVSDNEMNHLFGVPLKVQTLKYAPLTEIPERLTEKGFQEIMTSVYLIST